MSDVPDSEDADGIKQEALLTQFLDPLWRSKKRYIVLAGGAGSGKAVCVDDLVVTPTGNRQMKDIEVGDFVVSQNGKPTKVIHKIDVGTVATYEMTFDDGRTCRCSGDHLWNYSRTKRTWEKSGQVWKVATTEQLKTMVEQEAKNVRHYRIAVPLCEPVEFINFMRHPAIEPYLLGLLLGDGCITVPHTGTSVNVTNMDKEVIDYCKASPYYRTTYKKSGTEAVTLVLDGLQPALRSLGLLGCDSYGKFVPDSYLRASVEQRWELLRGLMDTDGTVDKQGHPSYCTSSKRLADDVTFLVRSLGGYCKVTTKIPTYTSNGEKKQGAVAYILYIVFNGEPKQLFRIARKQKRMTLVYNGGHGEKKLAITSIVRIADQHCQCIAVDNPSSLFLIDDFIVTHNSQAVSTRMAYLFLTVHNCQFLVVRGTLPALKRTAYLGDVGVISAMKRMGVDPIAKGWLNKTDKVMIHPTNGNIMYFSQVDDPEKIKSMNVNYIWAEEATELDPNKFAQLDARLRNETTGIDNQFFLSYNPIAYSNWAVQMFQVNPTDYYKENTYVSFSNFTQNPYLGMPYIRALLEKAKHDTNFYHTYVLGIPGRPLGQIYPSIKQSPSATWPKEVWSIEPYYGVDWGYIDPMVLVEARDYAGTTYCRCLYYASNRTPNDLADFMHSIQLKPNAPIYCDSASPERIELLAHLGFPLAVRAMKEINAGITCLQGKSIVIDNSGQYGAKFSDELGGYTYEPDPMDSSKFIEGKPIDVNNHIMDAMRYAIYTQYMRQRSFMVETFNAQQFQQDLQNINSMHKDVL